MRSILKGILTPAVTQTVTALAIDLAEVWTTATLNVVAEWLNEDDAESSEPPQSIEYKTPDG